MEPTGTNRQPVYNRQGLNLPYNTGNPMTLGNPWGGLPISPMAMGFGSVPNQAAANPFGILPWRGQLWPGMGPGLPPVSYPLPSGQPGSGENLTPSVPTTGGGMTQAGGAAGMLPAGGVTGLLPGAPPPSPQNVYLPRGISPEIPGFNPMVPGGNFAPQWHDIVPPAPPAAPAPEPGPTPVWQGGSQTGYAVPRGWYGREAQQVARETGADTLAVERALRSQYGGTGFGQFNDYF